MDSLQKVLAFVEARISELERERDKIEGEQSGLYSVRSKVLNLQQEEKDGGDV